MTPKMIPLPNRAKDLSGQVFGRTVAIAPVAVVRGTTIWMCVCYCGKIFTRAANDMKRPQRHSCGCLGANVSHGLLYSREHTTWQNIIQRCTNPNQANDPRYGGRGITVCEAWRNSFYSFYSDMGDKPAGASIDRIDNNGNYTPENCRWASPSEQANNRRAYRHYKNANLIAHNGLEMTISEWSTHLGIRKGTLYRRFQCGWPVDRALQPL